MKEAKEKQKNKNERGGEKVKNSIKSKRQRGITLIALVITIIVLLILAGVSIAMLTGENGILTKSTEAKVENAHAEVKEAIRLEYAEYMLEKNTNGSTQTFIEYLQERDIIPETTEEEGKYVISVKALVGRNLSLGNGTDGKDVYKLEEVTEEESTGKTNEVGKVASNTPVKIAVTDTSGGKKYKIMYYGKKDSENKEIDTLSDTKKILTFTIYDVDLSSYKEFSCEEGTTWGQFVEKSEYFEIYNDNYVCLTKQGRDLFETESSSTFMVKVKNDSIDETTPVKIDDLIDSKITYALDSVGG